MEYTKENTCGCRVETDKHLNTKWLYCPMHKAAPDMQEALKEVKEVMEISEVSYAIQGQVGKETYLKVIKALAKVKED